MPPRRWKNNWVGEEGRGKDSLTIQGRVFLRYIHAESMLIRDGEIAGPGRSRDIQRRVQDDEGVGLGQEGRGGAGFVIARVPRHRARRFDALVGGDGVELRVDAARRQHVDVAGRDGE